MSLRINQNVLAMRAFGSLQQTDDRLSQAVERLSTGLRINRAADDPTGLAVSERLRRQIRGLSRASLNGQDALSLVQTAEGAMNETQSILQRMRELAVQAGNDVLASSDRLEIQNEITTLRDDINRISRGTEFNTRRLLDGSQAANISSSSPAIQGIATGTPREAVADYSVSIALLQSGISEMQTSQIQYLKDVASTLAKGSTQLQSLAAFTDADGNSLLSNPQTLTVQGNGRSAGFTIDGQMTFSQLAAALQNALASPAGLAISGSKVGAVTTATTGVAGVGGYIQMTSGLSGKDTRVALLGDTAVIDALGFTVARQAVDSAYSVSIRDRAGNTNAVQTEGNRVSGLLSGVDILFSSQAAQVAGSTGLEAGLHLSANETFTLSVAAAAIGVPVTLTPGYWSLEGLSRSIQAQMDVAVNGVATISGITTSVVNGQVRITYDTPAAVAATGNDISISSYSGAALNFSNGDSPGFVDSSVASSKVAWGFSKYFDSSSGVASGTRTTIRVSDGKAAPIAISVFSTVGTFGPASQTVSDLVRFSDWQATVNETLATHTAMVRLFQIGEALAFTALRVGRENISGKSPVESLVELSSLTSPFTTRFGFESATQISARGAGDANFQLHVVNRSPEYLIGANQGEVLKAAFADMGASALGVDNLNVTTLQGAGEALSRIETALDRVSAERAKLGAWQNRLEETIYGLQNASGSLTEAESRIRDADIAAEMIEFTRDQIVAQSGTAMVAQANSHAMTVFKLLV